MAAAHRHHWDEQGLDLELKMSTDAADTNGEVVDDAAEMDKEMTSEANDAETNEIGKEEGKEVDDEDINGENEVEKVVDDTDNAADEIEKEADEIKNEADEIKNEADEIEKVDETDDELAEINERRKKKKKKKKKKRNGEQSGAPVDLSIAEQTQMHESEDERKHLESVCRAYRQYGTFTMSQWSLWRHRIQQLHPETQSVLPDSLRPFSVESKARTERFHKAVVQNQFCLDLILKHAGMPNSQSNLKETWASSESVSKVSSVLKSLYRDWSIDGRAERDQCYQPLLEGTKQHLPVSTASRPPRLVVPGAGVGRLALELASLGYEVQGNEFSLHMLLASDFILNSGWTPERQLHINPWLLETQNIRENIDQIRSVAIPDVDPVFLLEVDNENAPEFSMAAGEFVSIYADPSQHEKWDGVVAAFFLDTAPCIVDYIRVIHSMLVEGGVLLSLGPLLYHWSGPPIRPDDGSFEGYFDRHAYLDPRYLQSVDVSWEDVKIVMENVGFDIVDEKFEMTADYTSNSKSMKPSRFECVYCVARKRPPS